MIGLALIFCLFCYFRKCKFITFFLIIKVYNHTFSGIVKLPKEMDMSIYEKPLSENEIDSYLTGNQNINELIQQM